MNNTPLEHDHEYHAEQRRIHLQGHGEIPDGAIFESENYEPLPSLLKRGDRIASPKHHSVPEVYTIVGVETIAGMGDVYQLKNSYGTTLYDRLSRQQLEDFDYCLVSKTTT